MKLPFSPALSPALAGALAVLGVEFFLIVSVALQFVRGDYDWIATPLSFYLLGPYSGWLIAAYFTLAGGIALLAWAFHRELAPSIHNRAPLVLFVAGAVCVCIVALAHTNTHRDPVFTLHGLIHNTAAAFAFLCVTLGMLFQSWRFHGDPYWGKYHRRALILAAVTFAALWVYALWHALPTGLAQKCVILLIVLWLLMAGRWLMLTRFRDK